MEDILDVARYAPSPTNAQNVRLVLFQTKESIRELSMRVAEYYLDLERQLGDPQIRAETDTQVGKRTVDIYSFHLPAIIERFRAVQKGDDQLFYNAPLVIALYASGMAHLATASCSMTALEMLLAAETIGLAGCFNGYALTALTRDRATASYAEIPPGYTPGAVLTLGHPAVHYRLVPPRRKPRIVRRK
jgi:nitroreductase